MSSVSGTSGALFQPPDPSTDSIELDEATLSMGELEAASGAFWVPNSLTLLSC